MNFGRPFFKTEAARSDVGIMLTLIGLACAYWAVTGIWGCMAGTLAERRVNDAKRWNQPKSLPNESDNRGLSGYNVQY